MPDDFTKSALSLIEKESEDNIMSLLNQRDENIETHDLKLLCLVDD